MMTKCSLIAYPFKTK